MTICKASRTYYSGFFRLIIALSWVIFSLVHVSAWAGEARVVRVGYYDNPPKLFRWQQGEPKGVFPGILAVIAKEENWRLEWVPGFWLQGLNNLMSGRIDIMPDVAYSTERAGKYDFSNERKIEEELLKIRKLESLGVLAGGIAHDFNNTLATIFGNIELTKRLAGSDGGTERIECANVENGLVEPFAGMPDKNYVKIVLSDTGSGICPEIIDKIFDPFFTTKEKGSSLGLAICHFIIIRHQGRIFVESTPNVGTTFTIYLPASDAGKESRKGMDRKHNGQQPQSARIMVMDDEDLVKKVVKSQLEYLGHEVLFVADGSEAVELYRKRLGTEKKIDCIIMDLTIPGGVGGKDAVQDILAMDPDARVIVASGYFNDPVMANYREYGFMAAVSKPFNLDELQQAIASVLT